MKGGAGGAEDAAGNPIAADKAWAFKTAAPASATTTVSLASVADTRIVENLPDTNYRRGNLLYAEGVQPSVSSLDVSSLLRWDLSALPAASVVRSATVPLNVTASSKDTHEVYGALRPRVEGQATWNVYASGGNWEAAGAKGSLKRAPTVLGTIPPGTTGKQTITLNSGGISRVQSWVDSGQNNYGRIIANAANKDGLQFSSREATDAALRPMLEVTYTPPS